MSITAEQVKVLRSRTGAGLMDCKKALSEVAGDLEQAIELLRAKGVAKAEKRGGRVAAQGGIAVAMSDDQTQAAIVEVNCETDFVARGDDFQSLLKNVADIALNTAATSVESLLAQDYVEQGTVGDQIHALVARIGENIQVRRVSYHSGEGYVTPYLHGSKIGVLVALSENNQNLGRDLAMHIAASLPLAINEKDIAQEVLDKEQRIYEAQAAESNKPAEIQAKMVAGKMQKFMKANALVHQPFVKDPDLSIAQLLTQQGGVDVHAFVRYELGEGISVVQENLADAVSQLLPGAESNTEQTGSDG